MKVVLQEQKAASAMPAQLAATCDPDVVDWDACLVTPPPRPQGTIQVQLTYAGRSRPVPLSDPHTA
jgi:hypothetical protein